VPSEGLQLQMQKAEVQSKSNHPTADCKHRQQQAAGELIGSSATTTTDFERDKKE
jgi:hypothetical protein